MKQEIFNDERSKSIIFVAHCILNQNAKSDGTALYPGAVNEVIEIINSKHIGIVQMPCPEIHCLGLDRGDTKGVTRPVVEENTRIRNQLLKEESIKKIKSLVEHVVYQIQEYIKHGFEIKGIIGINRSPSCGVNTTSKNNKEVDGQGVFISELQKKLTDKNIQINIIGIKTSEPDLTIRKVKELFK